MCPIRNFYEAQAVLATFVPPAGSMKGNYTLGRMYRLMAALDNPQDSYKVVHIAGTSGKTSTGYYMSALLKASGKKVGLTISPHVDEVNERVHIDLVPLNEPDYCRELTEFLGIVQKLGLSPTYFELLIAFAYWEFARQGVDYAVVEVGLGGLLDGTNVMHRADKACILTDIGFDHTEILGHDIGSIAAQKAGIILPHNLVVSYTQRDEVMAIFRGICSKKHAKAFEISQPEKMPFASNLPSIQQRNWFLAYCTFQRIADRDTLNSLTNEALQSTQTITIPARTEVLHLKDKTIIFDGAHNGQKMTAAVNAVREKFGATDIAVLVGMLEDRQSHVYTAMAQVTGVAHFMIASGFLASQDLPRRPLDPDRIVETCNELGYQQIVAYDKLKDAVSALLARPEPTLFITGSFYLMRLVRDTLGYQRN